MNLTTECTVVTTDQLSEMYRDFVTEEDRGHFQRLLEDTEDWLYGDGEDTTKSVYVSKVIARLVNDVSLTFAAGRAETEIILDHHQEIKF